ncbi:kinase-like domain-containing protein [Trichoderma aethiopicum]
MPLGRVINLTPKDYIRFLCLLLGNMYLIRRANRDVKPDNVLIQKRGQSLTAKLADFGTSKRDDGAKMDTFTGTELYMAPGLFQRPRCYADNVDIWFLGLIAIQLFTPWSPALDNEWDVNDFGPWIRNVILANIAESPRQFRPLLYGLLVRSRHRGGVPEGA